MQTYEEWLFLFQILRDKFQAGGELQSGIAGRSGISYTQKTRALDDPWMENGLGISSVQKEQLEVELQMGEVYSYINQHDFAIFVYPGF